MLRKAGCKSLDGYLSAGRHEVVPCNGSLPEAFGIHFRRAKRAAARERGPPCAPPSSATPWVHWSRLGRLIHGGYSLEKSRCPTLRSSACPSQVPQRTWCCPRTKVAILTRAKPGPWSVLVTVRSSTLPSPRAPSAAQVGMENHSSMHRYSLLRRITLRPRCKSAVRCGRQPAIRATGAAHVRLPDLQAVQKQQLAVKAELAQLQAPHSLPEHQDLHKRSLGERLSLTAGVWRPPSYCEDWPVARPAALVSEQTWQAFVTFACAVTATWCG